jgi:hypothetical protein
MNRLVATLSRRRLVGSTLAAALLAHDADAGSRRKRRKRRRCRGTFVSIDDCYADGADHCVTLPLHDFGEVICLDLVETCCLRAWQSVGSLATCGARQRFTDAAVPCVWSQFPPPS